MTFENDYGSITETMGIHVFRNGRENISMQQQGEGMIVEFTDGEALLLLQGLAQAMGYRLVKKKEERP